MNQSDHKSLVIYFIILSILVAAVVTVAKMSGQPGYIQAYMLMPAIAAIITRALFYKPRFRDANLRLGRWSDYVRFWLFSLGITAVSLAIYTVTGSISWDFTGSTFLKLLGEQFAAAGQDMNAGLPPGWTPQTMMIAYFIGALTVFNILPGIITGFGEEFGHRGFMFPILYRINPWVGLVGGALIWFAWHQPLLLVAPPQPESPVWETVLNLAVTALASIGSFTYLAYVYVKSRSVFVAAVAHIVMNNAAGAARVFVTVQNQFVANAGMLVTMALVVAILYYRNELRVFGEYFAGEGRPEAEQWEPAGKVRPITAGPRL